MHKCVQKCVSLCVCIWRAEVKTHTPFLKHKQKLRSCACRAFCLLSDPFSLQVLLIQSKECTGFYVVHISLSLSPPPKNGFGGNFDLTGKSLLALLANTHCRRHYSHFCVRGGTLCQCIGLLSPASWMHPEAFESSVTKTI